MNDTPKIKLENGFTCTNLEVLDATDNSNKTISCERCGLSVDIADDGKTIYSNFIVNQNTGKIERKEYNVGLAEASKYCSALEVAFGDKNINAETIVELAESVVGLVKAPLELITMTTDVVKEGEPVSRHDWDDDRCTKCGDKDWFAGPVCER